MTKKTVLHIFFILYLSPVIGQNFEEVTIKTTKITESIFMLEGSGGNIGVCTGKDGVFIVDDQFAPLTEKISQAIANISDSPIQFIINTHYHGDHTGGNENFAQNGAIIFSHENARKRIESGWQKSVENKEISEIPDLALPKVTLTEAVTFHYNDEEISIFYKGSGHTDGDVVVHFTRSNIFHMGDLFVRYGFPYVDMGAGGNVTGMISALDYVLSISDEKSVFIPGHGQLATKSDVLIFRNMLHEISQRVLTEKGKGTKLEDLSISEMIEGYEEIPGNSAGFVSAIYNSSN